MERPPLYVVKDRGSLGKNSGGGVLSGRRGARTTGDFERQDSSGREGDGWSRRQWGSGTATFTRDVTVATCGGSASGFNRLTPAQWKRRLPRRRYPDAEADRYIRKIQEKIAAG